MAIRLRYTAGFALLCVCFFSAAPQNAFAAPAKNTTTVTCIFEGGEKDFSDAHCDKKVEPKKGKFGHVAHFPPGTPFAADGTSVKTRNGTLESSDAIFKGTVFGVKNEITCKTVAGEGTFTNSEPVSKEHKVTGSLTVKFTSCTVNKPAIGCKVKEPITVKAHVEGVEGLGAGKNEMGLEFKPSEGETFNEITLEGCFIAGTFKTTGTAIGTGTPAPAEKHSGATSVFTNEMTKETLKLAGNPAEISSTITWQGKSSEAPVAFTTPT